MDLSLFKCKNCGAELDTRKAVGGVIECGYCHTPWTVPKEETTPEARKYLHDGNAALDVCKFEDAYTYFQKAAELDQNEPEAYFGMALASFKVQYLKDEVNNRLQPICHEITDKKFTESLNYLLAFRHATNEQRAQYEKKGAEIDYILKEFFKLKQAGINYDCFLCTKVTDDTTEQPTEDSKDADYIYRLLQDKGYKPFYSERELRNVTGADYEARILYALYESECMIVVCRKEEYLKTKWVKNEYTRFLKLVNDEEKDSDSIAIVFNGTPIEKLPGRNGKLQGIDFALRESDGKIVDFVEMHTPEAKRRREEAANSQAAQAEAIRAQIEEQRRAQQALEEKLAALQSKGESAIIDTSDGELLQELKLAREAREKEEISKNFEIVAGILKKYKGSSQSVTIPDVVVEIGENAFADCMGLTSVTIPTNVRKIGNKAFYYCSNLLNISMGTGLIEIGEEAFSGCKSLTGIEIPNGVTAIGLRAFQDCSNLRSITIPSGLLKIGDEAFKGCKGLTDIEIPNGVTAIGQGAFQDCSNLKKIMLPGSVSAIGMKAFSDCTSLTDIQIPNSVTQIGSYAFSGCKGLTNIQISNSVTQIGIFAFTDCTGLTNIQIPNSVTEIGASAFSGCTGLTNVKLGNNVRKLDRCAFDSCTNLKSIEIPDSLEPTDTAFPAFYRCQNLSKIVISDFVLRKVGSVFLKKVRNDCDGVLELKGKGELQSFQNFDFGSFGKIVLSDGYTSIAKSAFENNKTLFEIVIPSSVKTIGEAAFRTNDDVSSNLKKVVISNGVTTICKYAFYNCKSLSEIVIPNSVISIDEFAFYSNRLQRVTIPERFKGFLNSGLKKIFGYRWKQINFTFTE